MRQLTEDVLHELWSPREGPCVSLYQPTHRHHPDAAQDPIRFRNLLKEVEASLRRAYPARDVERLLRKLRTYERDSPFWEHQLDGLAMFASPGSFRLLQLQRPVGPLALVAGRFHLKPLIRIVQSADRYQVLCLSQGRVALYEGNRYALDEVELRGVPHNLVEALGEELTEPHLTVASYNGAGGAATHHGHGGRADETEKDVVRYLRAVDRAVWEHHSRPSGLPLMLAALPQYHSIFRHVSHNPRLLPEGLELDPDRVDADRLRDEAWGVFEPQYRARVGTAVNHYRAARASLAGSDVLPEVAAAAAAGRINTLLVEADRHLGGRIQPDTGRVELGDLADPAYGDVFDYVAEQVLRTRGDVYVIPREHMPTRTGFAAVYRF